MLRTLFNLASLISLLVFSCESFSADRVEVTPESCVKTNDVCETKLDINWQTENEIAVCIRIANQQNQVTCFEQASVKHYQTFVNTQRTLVVELLDADTRQMLARTKLNVFVSEYKKRKRKRHAWSVIL